MKKKLMLMVAMVCAFLVAQTSIYASDKGEVVNPFARYEKNIFKIKEKLAKLKSNDKTGNARYTKKLEKARKSLKKAAERKRAVIEKEINKIENKIDKVDDAGGDTSALEKEIEKLNDKLDQIDKWEDEAMQEDKVDPKKKKKK